MDHQKLIDAHWKYVEAVLKTHGIRNREIAELGYRQGMHDGLDGENENDWYTEVRRFHYQTAYKHGKKHREAGKC